MIQRQHLQGWFAIGMAAILLLGGCTTALVQDDRTSPRSGAHCSNSEGVDDSSITVLPVPVIAFFVPHVKLHDIKADNYLSVAAIRPNWSIARWSSTGLPVSPPP